VAYIPPKKKNDILSVVAPQAQPDLTVQPIAQQPNLSVQPIAPVQPSLSVTSGPAYDPATAGQDNGENIIGRIGDAVRGAGNAIAEPYNYFSKAVSNAVNESNPDVQAAQESDLKLSNQYNTALAHANAKMADPNTPIAEKARWKAFFDKTKAEADAHANKVSEQNQQFIQETDPTKAVASGASIAADILTAGVGGAGVVGTKAAVEAAKVAGEPALKAGAKDLLVQGVKTGVTAIPQGALSPVVEHGKEATPEEIAKGAAAGFLGGALLPVAGFAADKLLSKPLAKIAEGFKNLGEDGYIGQPRAGGKFAAGKEIHPNDIKVMTDFMDYARGARTFQNPDKALILEDMASRVAEHYGFKMPKTVGGLANEFDKQIMGNPSLLERVKATLASESGHIGLPDSLAGKDPLQSKPLEPVLDLKNSASLPKSLAETHGVKQETVDKLVSRYGQDSAEAILRQADGAKNIRSKDAFVVGEARKQFGDGSVKITGAGEGRFSPIEVKNGVKEQLGTAFIDRAAPVLGVLKKAEKQSGKSGLVDQFLYDTGLQSRSNSIANAKINNSQPLHDALSGLDKKGLAEFNEYAAARSELSNADRGMKTSRPVEELKATIQRLGGEHNPRFVAMNQYYKDLAKDALDNGLIDSKKYDEFVANDDYVRTQRDLDELVNHSGGVGNSYSLGRSITSQKRKGSTREILPADQTAFNYTQDLQKEIQRNKTASNLIDTLQQFGMARELTAKEAVNKNTIKRLVDGKTQVFEIDPEIKKVVDNIAPYQLNALEKIVAAPARIFRAGTTGLSAPFTAANYIKDQIGSGINSKAVMATHNPANVFSGLYEAGKDQFVGSHDELWQKFIAHAGDTTSYDMTRNVRSSKELSAEIRGGQAVKVGHALIHPIRTLEDVNSITEKATRFQNFKGVYNEALKGGATEQEALQHATLAAWQNSVDFNRAGDWARAVNLLVPYFNASIQGSRQLVRSFADRPLATSAKVLAGVTMPLAGLTAYNMADPERRKIYNNISEFEKENNFILIPPDTKQNADGTYDVFKVPIPPGFGNLAQPARRAIESFVNGNPVDGVKMAQDLIQAVSGPLDPHNPAQAVGGLTPQFIKPAVQQAANKDLFTGKEIVPAYMNSEVDSSGNPVAEKDKSFKYTSGSARAIGGILNVSPIRVEKFIKDTLGKVGQYSENAIDTGLAAAGKIPSDQIGGVSAAEDISRRFTKAQGVENYNKSEGAKFFDDVKAVTSGLNQNDIAAFNAIHPAKKNSQGQTIDDKSIVDGAEKAVIYMTNPKVFEADKALDKKSRDRGKPGNPIFDLTPQQRQVVLSIQANKGVNPGDNSMTDVMVKQNESWIKPYYDKASAFYDAVKTSIAKGDKNVADPDPSGIPRVTPNDTVSQKLKALDQLTDPAQRAAFYKQNPDVTDYYGQLEDYNRAKRAFLGLPQLDKFPDAPPEVAAKQDAYFGMTDKKARSAYIKANPDLADYWNKKNQYQLANAGATARFEGQDFTDKDYKTISSLAAATRAKTASGSNGISVTHGDFGSAKSISTPKISVNVKKITINKRTTKKIPSKKIAIRKGKLV
jgi:hypothetical protein